jgi:hypothetical protein
MERTWTRPGSSEPRRSSLTYANAMPSSSVADLQVRCRQSIVGVGRVVVQPLVIAFVFALFFGLTVEEDPPEAPQSAGATPR